MDDVETALTRAEAQLPMIRTLYEADLELQRPSPTLRSKVRMFVELERAALDHLAERIVKSGGAGEAHVHYPLAADAPRFEPSIDKNMPGVRAALPEVAAAIGRRQPYIVPGLGRLRHLLLDEKHQRLTPRTEAAPPPSEPAPPEPDPVPAAPAPRPPPSGGTGSGLTGPMFINGIEYDPVTLRRLDAPAAPVRDQVYVEWRFEGDDVDALNRLDEIHAAVKAAIDEVAATLG
jgi:hypothetical protein